MAAIRSLGATSFAERTAAHCPRTPDQKTQRCTSTSAATTAISFGKRYDALDSRQSDDSARTVVQGGRAVAQRWRCGQLVDRFIGQRSRSGAGNRIQAADV